MSVLSDVASSPVGNDGLGNAIPPHDFNDDGKSNEHAPEALHDDHHYRLYNIGSIVGIIFNIDVQSR